MRRALLPALLLLGSLCASVHGSSVLLLDAQHNGFLAQRGVQKHSLNVDQLQGLVSALTGLEPGLSIDGDASEQFATLVAPSLLHKPRVFLSVNLLGVKSEELPASLQDRNQLHVTVKDTDSQAAQQGPWDVVLKLAQANSGVAMHLLDSLGAQGCDDQDNCVAWVLPQLAQAVAGSFSSGVVSLGPDGSHVLDFSSVHDRVFATELAGVVAGLGKLLVSGQQQEDVAVLDASIMGLRGIAHQYGEGSPKALACKAAALNLLSWAVQQLDAAFDGEVVVQVVLISDVAAGPGPLGTSPESAVAWKEQRRSRVLQETVAQTFPPVDQAAAAKKFTSKAAAFGAFLILLYFGLAAVYCLCFMPFKRDTLLYGSKKAD